MEFKSFLNNHWDIFLRHLCQFHPLEFEFLREYEYELDWRFISKNKRIEWNLSILEAFEDRFLWHELAWNESIIWETKLIERFEKRLDWYYLGRNTNLPLSSSFINAHRKNILISENNKFLTKELIKQYGKDLIPAFTPVKFELTDDQINKLEDIIASGKDLRSQAYTNLYEEFIFPNINNQSISEIFEEKFDFSQRYFRMRPLQNDIYGLTPEFMIKGKNPFEQFREGLGLFELDENLKLKNGSLQEGPPRLYEVLRFSGLSFYPILLVSENIKVILQKFNISKHRFIPITFFTKKIKTDLQYFIFQLEYDSLLKQADFKTLEFQKLTKKKWSDRYKKEQLEKGAIKDYESMKQMEEDLKSNSGLYSKFVPSHYSINSNEDVFTMERDIIVNEYVKNAIEKIIPKQVQFDSVQLLNIKILQEVYDSKNKIYFSEEMRFVTPTTAYSQAFLFYRDKKRRLEKTDPPLNSQVKKDEFFQIQIKLNVIIPEAFKIRYRENQLPGEEYDFLPVDLFYTQNEYAERNPETYKSVIVAENGCGDALGLILSKEDDHKLRHELYEFNHETGEAEKYKP